MNGPKCTKRTTKNRNKTTNLRLSLQCSTTIGIIIQITANVALALRSIPFT